MDLLKASKSVAKEVRDQSENIGSLKGQGSRSTPLSAGRSPMSWATSPVFFGGRLIETVG